MTSKEFVATFHSELSEYCPCVIDWEGQVHECNEVPENISPLFYLTAKLKCVLVDYENQIYSEDLSQEQRYALLDLSEAKLILLNPTDIKGKVTI